ncbi:MAG: fatty acid cis/trans isomerase [Nannocystaceae bacterium]|nr:fatty acid cis/trans isomerase [Nannocystaceae bacterium]
MRLRFYLLALAVAAACVVVRSRRLDRRFGDARPVSRTVQTLPEHAVDYWTEVRPIVASRCVVCHGCYDAPCQLKLGSPEGIDRGGTEAKVYEAVRLLEAPMTRLFEDAQTTPAWRHAGFHPVLNERTQSVLANREAGVLPRLLNLKQAHPLTDAALLPQDIDVSIHREQVCPSVETLDDYEDDHPSWGMPFGVPGLQPKEHDTLMRWVEQGAVHTPPEPLDKPMLEHVDRWETYFNDSSLKGRLTARYMYEHLFLAHLYFEDLSQDVSSDNPAQFFELVRSRTPPGQPVERIATRRPFDDPGVRPYYRLQPVRESIVAKLHLPYALSDARMARWRSLFQDASFSVSKLPSYAPEVASNPFVAFGQLPAASRYQFMLDEAQFTLMGFIKGAVCRGPIALNVINDHFYIFFLAPEFGGVDTDAFLRANAASLAMPAAAGSNAPGMVTWVQNAARQRKYMEAKRAEARRAFGSNRKVTLETLWDGGATNPNAVLTVFRHFDSATVAKGMVGGMPKTAWVLGYPLLERIHYLLVAGFDVYGNVGHQLATRAYMDFLRMEAEFTFLVFLPEEARKKEREYWYRDTNERIAKEITGQLRDLDVRSGIDYTTGDPKWELYLKLRRYLSSVLDERAELRTVSEALREPLKRLTALRGTPVSRMPEMAFLLVPDAAPADQVFTLLRNSAHSNIASPLNERDRRLPAEDTLSVVRGFGGTYPKALYRVPTAELEAFVAAVESLVGEDSYARLQARYGVRRTDDRFWSTVDRLHQIYAEQEPIEAGLFDISRVENR